MASGKHVIIGGIIVGHFLVDDVAHEQAVEIGFCTFAAVGFASCAVALVTQSVVGRSAVDFAALEPQCRECLRTGEYDLLAELTQPHRLSELVDGNRVIDKSAGEREIRIVGTISDDDVSLTGIRQTLVSDIPCLARRRRLSAGKRRFSTSMASQFRMV